MADSDEDELLKRFNALKAPKDEPVDTPKSALQKQSQVAKDEDDELERIADGRYVPPRATKGNKDEDKELKARVASLSGREVVEDEAELDDDEVEAFMASLSSSNAPHDANDENGAGVLTPPEDVAALDREASALLKSTSHLVDRNPPSDDPQENKAVDGPKVDEEETEEQILSRALEAASLDRLPSPSDSPPPSRAALPGDSTPSEPTFAFPSLPTHNPDSAGEDPEVAARMNLLFGLSGPTSKPAAKGRLGPPPSARQAGQGWNIAGYNDSRDDDLDSWCCMMLLDAELTLGICNQDATVQCLGCDGDLYCGKCWAEGHGPGGEQGHKVRKFTWSRKRTGA